MQWLSFSSFPPEKQHLFTFLPAPRGDGRISNVKPLGSDPDHRGGGCERRRGAAVAVQVDGGGGGGVGVVAGGHAAKGGARARLSVPQALEVTLERRGEGRGGGKTKTGLRRERAASARLSGRH